MTEATKILVVDDNQALLDTLSIILKRKGFDVDIAGDGFKALERCHKETFDIVLMDIVMPELNGFETFKKIRELQANTPVILMTAYSDETIMQDALKEGVVQIVNKPFNIDVVVNTLRTMASREEILIVDDDKDVTETLSRALEAEGYKTAAATSVERAIEIAASSSCLLAFINPDSLKLDSMETYLRLKEQAPEMEIVLMTGFDNEARENTDTADNTDTITCLNKPLSPDNAIQMVKGLRKSRK